MNLLRTVIATAIIAFAPAAAWAQRVDKVPDGDTIVVHGVGKVHLLGIKTVDQPAVQLGQSPSPPQPPKDPPVPTTPAVSGRLNLSHDRSARDLLRKLALGRTVRIEYDPLVVSKGEPSAYLFLDDGTLLNAEMLKAGQARLDDTRQFERENEFKRLEAEARSAAVGIWIR
jgi:endonuclease YncB( thermonuclease family)